MYIYNIPNIYIYIFNIMLYNITNTDNLGQPKRKLISYTIIHTYNL